MSVAPEETLPLASIEVLPRKYYQPPYDGIEYVDLYIKGGYHPTHLGDVLDGRYEVIHRLGDGGYATVWLCCEIRAAKWRAIKIITADKSSEDCPELRFQGVLGTSDQFALPLEHFWIEGPNGRHLCLVLPVLGPDVARKMETDNKIIRRICQKAAGAMNTLHANGICHGDFRPTNILCKLRDLDALGKEFVLHLIGKPNKVAIRTLSGQDAGLAAPMYLVRALDVESFKDLIIPGEIAIIDFGIAFQVANPPRGSTGIPVGYVAPEVLLGGKPSVYSDIWSLGCTILELYTKEIFGTSADEVFETAELYLGPMPEQYRCIWKKLYQREELGGNDSHRDEHQTAETFGQELTRFTERPVTWDAEDLTEAISDAVHGTKFKDPLEGTLGKTRCLVKQSLGGLATMTEFKLPEQEVIQIADLLRCILRYMPEQRYRASAVLEHPWLASDKRSRKAAFLK